LKTERKFENAQKKWKRTWRDFRSGKRCYDRFCEKRNVVVVVAAVAVVVVVIAVSVVADVVGGRMKLLAGQMGARHGGHGWGGT
jgi:hypothetical protein